MALCTIPIQVKKIGGEIQYNPVNKSSDTIVYSNFKDFAGSNVQLISNESLYCEITKLFDIFDNKKPDIKLFSSEKPIWYTPAGKLNTYCSEVSKETLSEKEVIPTIIGRVDPVESIKHAKLFELNEHNFLRHLGSVGEIAQICDAEPHQYTIKGNLLEYLSCPKCLNDGSNTHKSGLSLNIALSNQVSDQESKLEECAQELLELLQNGGYELVSSEM